MKTKVSFDIVPGIVFCAGFTIDKYGLQIRIAFFCWIIMIENIPIWPKEKFGK